MSLPQWGIIACQWRVILEIARRYLDFLVAEGGQLRPQRWRTGDCDRLRASWNIRCHRNHPVNNLSPIALFEGAAVTSFDGRC